MTTKQSAAFLALIVSAVLGLAYAAERAGLPDWSPQRGDAGRQATTTGEWALVTRVVDGDTVEVILAGRTEKVRYIGVDAPESVKPGAAPECYGKESSERNRELVLGREVRLVRDVSERDRYGRLLRYVYAGEAFVNLELVREGYAHASTFPPDVAKSSEFVAAERDAKLAGHGLWSGCPKGSDAGKTAQ